MIRTLTIASLASLFALSIGCAVPTSAPAGESTDDALTAGASSSGYFTGTAPGLTDGLSVHLLNASSTKCGDGSKKALCDVGSLDFSALKLGGKDEAALENAFGAGRVIVKGHLSGDTLVAERAWQGVASNPQADDLDRVYRVNHEVQFEMCVQGASCARYKQVEVNVSSKDAELDVNDVSLDGAGSKDDSDAAEKEMAIGAEGLLVLGHDVALVPNNGSGSVRTLLATDFYLPVN